MAYKPSTLTKLAIKAALFAAIIALLLAFAWVVLFYPVTDPPVLQG